MAHNPLRRKLTMLEFHMQGAKRCKRALTLRVIRQNEGACLARISQSQPDERLTNRRGPMVESAPMLELLTWTAGDVIPAQDRQGGRNQSRAILHKKLFEVVNFEFAFLRSLHPGIDSAEQCAAG